MAKVISCHNLGALECSWVGRAKTEEKLYKIIAKHSKEAHGMKKIPKDLWAIAKELIQNEAE